MPTKERETSMPKFPQETESPSEPDNRVLVTVRTRAYMRASPNTERKEDPWAGYPEADEEVEVIALGLCCGNWSYVVRGTDGESIYQVNPHYTTHTQGSKADLPKGDCGSILVHEGRVPED